MDKALTANQKWWHQNAAAVADRLLAPAAAAIDAEGHVPRRILTGLAQEGLLALRAPASLPLGGKAPESVQGADADALAAVVVIEELAARCASSAALAAVVTGPVGELLRACASEAQRDELWPAIIAGESLACLAVDDEGRALRCSRDGEGGYLLSGTLQAVPGAAEADWAVVFCREGDEGDEGATVGLIVPLDAKGVRKGETLRSLGLRGVGIADLVFEGHRAAPNRRLGCAGPACQEALALASASKLVAMAALSVGIGRAALEAAVNQLQGTDVQQLTQFKLADMATRLDAARLLTWRAAESWRLRSGTEEERSKQAAMAKLMAAEAAAFVSRESAQICGSAGYLKDQPAERHLRDAKAAEFLFGASEEQRLAIGEVLAAD